MFKALSIVLLVKVWISVVPTKAPDGLALVVKAEVPLPTRTPDRVVVPVPPLDTGIGPGLPPGGATDGLVQAKTALRVRKARKANPKSRLVNL